MDVMIGIRPMKEILQLSLMTKNMKPTNIYAEFQTLLKVLMENGLIAAQEYF